MWPEDIISPSDGDLGVRRLWASGILDLSVEGTMSKRGQQLFQKAQQNSEGAGVAPGCLFLLMLWQTEGLEVLVSLTHYPGIGHFPREELMLPSGR